ncbi:reverse transcriptase domain-containing protein [Tanacetum coccineum]|uniref:Reverse transcriptase domain-containing protein n=1 Tax=Tanacetum coccineum TaxID=301880 RepID=A0ABQ5HJD5_9ASTR
MLASNFKKFSIKEVARSENKKADALSKIASTSFAHLTKQVLVEELKEKSTNKAEVLAIVEEEGNTWMTRIYEYLAEEILHAESKKQGRYGSNQDGTPRKESDTRMPRLPSSSSRAKKPISDNGKQFKDNPFKDWCEKLNIRQCFASVKHPQANSLVERANRSLGEGVKARLEKGSKDWIEEIPHVDMVQNNEALKLNMDLLEEKREQAAIREARSKAKMEKYYNSNVRNTSFKPGDFVYRNNDVSHAEDEGKLGPKWEGPYEVTEALAKGAYKLRDRNRKLLL